MGLGITGGYGGLPGRERGEGFGIIRGYGHYGYGFYRGLSRLKPGSLDFDRRLGPYLADGIVPEDLGARLVGQFCERGTSSNHQCDISLSDRKISYRGTVSFSGASPSP